jgi:GLPGLI family protein
MKIKIGINLILLLCFSIASFSQNTSGTITFERRSFWINIMSKFPFATKEDIERDMLTWGKNQGKWSEKYTLKFNEKLSIYTEVKDDSYGYSWKEDDYLIIRKNDGTAQDQVTFLSKTYVLSGETPKYKWKILNEIKEIQGFLCMKAETIDPIRKTKTAAWFTDKLPVGGPEGYTGLPGMILALEYNQDDVLIEAVAVDLTTKVDIDIPKKIKGKEIARNEYETKVQAYIKETLEGKKNPFWQIRY